MAVHRTYTWWRFRKILWPSQNIWNLLLLWYQMSKEAFPICMDGYVPIMSNGTKDLNQEEKCPTIRLPRLYNLGKTILSSWHCAIYYPVLKLTFSHYSNLYWMNRMNECRFIAKLKKDYWSMYLLCTIHLTANIVESGPMPTPWKFLAGPPLLPSCKFG